MRVWALFFAEYLIVPAAVLSGKRFLNDRLDHWV